MPLQISSRLKISFRKSKAVTVTESDGEKANEEEFLYRNTLGRAHLCGCWRRSCNQLITLPSPRFLINNVILSYCFFVGQWVRLHRLRQDRIHHQRRNRFQDQPGPWRSTRPFCLGLRSWILGLNGPLPRLLWAW